MTIGLVALYSSAILHDKKFGVLIGATLVLIYGFIFTILKLEDFSLMVGSLGIFAALSIVMYFSRKVDWSRSKV
jgi:inner membrane protein